MNVRCTVFPESGIICLLHTELKNAKVTGRMTRLRYKL